MRLVLCLDGTWALPDAVHPTNVVKLARNAVNDYQTQMVYYDQGLGTEGGRVERTLGGTSGLGIKRNIEEAYRFLIDNYRPGAHIYLFGYSRGAYTARSLAGLIDKCGILAPEHRDRVDQVLRYYTDRRSPDTKTMAAFRDRYAVSREVYFIGVFDTVGALGIPAGFVGRRISEWRNEFHDTDLSPLVSHAYHALALDERREAFNPTFWTLPEKASDRLTLEQLWFPGSHADVGGGSEATGLSDTALDWMQGRAVAAGLSLREDLPFPPAPDPLAPVTYADRDWPLPKAERLIDDCAPGCAFHDSVRTRILADATYQPGNLLSGDRRARIESLDFVPT